MKKLFLFLILIPPFALAQVPDPLPNTYVNDLTGSLTIQEIKKLNEKIRSIETKTSVQIAIVLINDLPADMEIEQYVLVVGRKWHVRSSGLGERRAGRAQFRHADLRRLG